MLASTMWFSMYGRESEQHTLTRDCSNHSLSNINKCFGGHSERETPGHIPNPEAKTLSADGTAGETLWESRTPPDLTHEKATHTLGGLFAFKPARAEQSLLSQHGHDRPTGAVVRV